MTTELSGCIPVDNDGRLLFIHRNTPELTQWEIIGGKVEPGESPEAAAVREAREEADIDVRIIRRLGEQAFYLNGRECPYIWWLADITKGTPYPQEKRLHDAVGWFGVNELRRLEDISPSLRNLRKKIVDGEVSLTV